MAAGNKRVVELHGSIHEVECMECKARQHRDELQQRLRWLNSAAWDTVALGVRRPAALTPGALPSTSADMLPLCLCLRRESHTERWRTLVQA